MLVQPATDTQPTMLCEAIGFSHSQEGEVGLAARPLTLRSRCQQGHPLLCGSQGPEHPRMGAHDSTMAAPRFLFTLAERQRQTKETGTESGMRETEMETDGDRETERDTERETVKTRQREGTSGGGRRERELQHRSEASLGSDLLASPGPTGL